jgi:hypothetical protein
MRKPLPAIKAPQVPKGVLPRCPHRPGYQHVPLRTFRAYVCSSAGGEETQAHLHRAHLSSALGCHIRRGCLSHVFCPSKRAGRSTGCSRRQWRMAASQSQWRERKPSSSHLIRELRAFYLAVDQSEVAGHDYRAQSALVLDSTLDRFLPLRSAPKCHIPDASSSGVFRYLARK